MWLITFTPNENIDTISLLSYLSQSKSAKKGKIGFCQDETFLIQLLVQISIPSQCLNYL